jgi:hypothetical protein
VAIANQKNHIGLYLMCVYGSEKLQKELAAGFKAAGKKLDMGKSCVRFKKLDDLAMDAVARAIAAVPMARYVAMAKAVHERPAAEKAAARKAAMAKAAVARAAKKRAAAKKKPAPKKAK